MEFKKVKLPRVTKAHPLIVGLEAAMKREGCTLTFLARTHFKLSQQSVRMWVEKAQADRDYNMPPRSVIPLCRLTGQPPYLYNPDLWPNKEWRV